MAKAGNFEVTVSQPYPCWIGVKFRDTEIRFRHDELPDLIFALQRAQQEAMRLLGTSANEAASPT